MPETCCEYADVGYEMMSITPENFDFDVQTCFRFAE
jgi:hypothetical protein